VRLLFKTLRWKIDSANAREMYSVDYHPDPLIFDVWHNQRRDVKFIAEDVWTLLPTFYELVLGKGLSRYPRRSRARPTASRCSSARTATHPATRHGHAGARLWRRRRIRHETVRRSAA
jgi:hypothetical protein